MGDYNFGLEYIYESDRIRYNSVAFNNDTEFLVAYSDDANSDYGTIKYGSIASDSVITYNTPYVFQVNATLNIDIIKLQENKFFIFYGVNTSGSGKICEIDPVTKALSFGPVDTFYRKPGNTSVVRMTDTSFITLEWNSIPALDIRYSTVSGNVITRAWSHSTGISSYNISMVKLDNTRVLLNYCQSSDYYPYVAVATLTLSAPSYPIVINTPLQLSAEASAMYGPGALVGNDKSVIAYRSRDALNVYTTWSNVITTAVDVCSAALQVKIDDGFPVSATMMAKNANNKCVFVSCQYIAPNYDIRMWQGKVSGTTVVWTNEQIPLVGRKEYINSDINSVDSIVNVYADNGNSYYGTSFVAYLGSIDLEFDAFIDYDFEIENTITTSYIITSTIDYNYELENIFTTTLLFDAFINYDYNISNLTERELTITANINYDYTINNKIFGTGVWFGNEINNNSVIKQIISGNSKIYISTSNSSSEITTSTLNNSKIK